MAELCKNPKFDLVILDAYSTGHFVKLLETPGAILDSPLVGPVVDETSKILQYLSNSDLVGTLVVAGSGPLICQESLDLLDSLSALPVASPMGVILNRLLFPLIDTRTTAWKNQRAKISSHVPESVLGTWAERVEEEDRALELIKEKYSPREIYKVPELVADKQDLVVALSRFLANEEAVSS